MLKAICNGVTLAESDDVVPSGKVFAQFLELPTAMARTAAS